VAAEATESVAPPPGATGGQSAARHAVMFTLARIAGSASMIVLFALLSHMLAAAEYGTFRQIWLLNRNSLNIFAVGIGLSIYYFIPRIPVHERRPFAIQSGLILTALGMVLSAALVFGAEPIARLLNNAELAPLLRIFGLYPLLVLPTTLAESLLLSLERTGLLSLYYVVDRVGLVLVAAVAALWSGQLSVVFLALLAYGALELLGCTFLLRAVLRDEASGPPVWRVREQLAFALPSGLANLADVVNAEIDKLITSMWFTAARFAVYANGAFEVPFFGVIVGSVSAVMLPRYARAYQAGDRPTVVALWHESVSRIATLLVPATVYLFIGATALIPLLFSDKYADSALIFRIYLLALLPKLAWYGPMLVAMGHNRAPLYGSVAAIVCNAVLALVLVRSVGLAGPAIASVVVAHGLLAYYLYLLARGLDLSWHRALPFGRLARVFAISLVAGAAAYPVFTRAALGPLLQLVIGGVLFSVALVALYLWAGLLDMKDIKLFTTNPITAIRRPRPE
jgi:O-antigen/teichoic acid export membrane protein